MWNIYINFLCYIEAFLNVSLLQVSTAVYRATLCNARKNNDDAAQKGMQTVFVFYEDIA